MKTLIAALLAGLALLAGGHAATADVVDAGRKLGTVQSGSAWKVQPVGNSWSGRVITMGSRWA